LNKEPDNAASFQYKSYKEELAMKQFKKCAAFALALMMVIGIAASCGRASATPAPGAPAASSSGWTYQKGMPFSEEKASFSVLTHSGHAVTLAVPNNDLPVYAAIMERGNIDVDWQIIENATFAEMVNVRLMSTDLPDCVVLWDQNAQIKMAEDDFFLAYDDIGKENYPYAQDLFAKDAEGARLEQSYRSRMPSKKIYGFGTTVIPRFLNENFVINTVWQEKLGIADPNTIDEFYDMLVAFRDNDPNGNGIKDEIPLVWYSSMPNALSGTFDLDNYSGVSYDANNNLEFVWLTNRYKDYLTFYNKLYSEDLLDKENRDLAGSYEMSAQDKMGGYCWWATFSQLFTGYSPYYNEDEGNYVFREIMPLDNVYDGKKAKYSRLTSGGPSEGMFVLKNAKNPEVIVRLADWLYASDEYAMLMNFGIEGVSYNMVNGAIDRVTPEGFPDAGTYVLELGGSQPPFAHRQYLPAWRENYPKWMVERTDQILPFYKDGLSPVLLMVDDQTEYNLYSADVSTHRTEMQANFGEGRRPLSEWDAYVTEILSMGGDKMLEILKNYF